jgi:hypothetical protein
MESCLGTSSPELLKLCDFSKLILGMQQGTEAQTWFEEWQDMNTKIEMLPGGRYFPGYTLMLCGSM